MEQQNCVDIRAAESSEILQVYTLIISNDEWTKFNGPYFPYTHPTLTQFEKSTFTRLVDGSDMQLIIFDGKPVGTVNCYWECKTTRWLEAGVVLYDANCWGHGIAAKAMHLWVSYLFEAHDIERVGMTTWSGNPRMMSLALKLGFHQEACLRKVRYHQGEYYDSIKFGVLREEWDHCS